MTTPKAMPTDPERVQQIMRYAVAVASSADDFRQRELGPIHLLKYVYLADLAHAETYDGRTYTGIPWRFHHFGPWALEAWHQIAPAMAMPGIRHRSFQGRYQDDVSRWRSEEPGGEERLETTLPHDVARAVRTAVYELGNDTSALLHHIYRTPPMLRAAPGERLDFSTVAASSDEPEVRGSPEPSPPPAKTARRRRRAAHDALRERFQEALEKSRQRRTAMVTPATPHEDADLAEVQTWVDGLAGEPIASLEGELIVSAEIWKSATRSGARIP